MDHNESQIETKSKEAFGALRRSSIEPSPFMKSRIMARLDEKEKTSKEVWVWRWIAFAATAACVGLVWFKQAPRMTQPAGEEFVAQQSYVIQVDLGGDRLQDARVAEVQLPEDVEFVSKAHPEVAKARSLRLPIAEVKNGRSKLPFVVRADKPGRRELKLRIFDSNGEMIQERILSVNFAAQKDSNVL